MTITGSLCYALLCVYYAGRATVLFTVEFLLFLPLYFLIERHDTPSRWLGRRAEAQLQPLLPTAFEYERASTAENSNDSATSLSHQPNSVQVSTAPSSSSHHENKKEAQRASADYHPGEEVDLAEASTTTNNASDCVATRCVMARDRLACLRSLRAARLSWWRHPTASAHEEVPLSQQQQQQPRSEDSSLATPPDLSRPGRLTNVAVSLQTSPELTPCKGHYNRDNGSSSDDDGHCEKGKKKSEMDIVSEASSGSSSSDVEESLTAPAIAKMSGEERQLMRTLRRASKAEPLREDAAPVTAAFFAGVDVTAGSELTMRAAVPSWCTAHFRRRSNNAAERRVQFGFLPPWYAVHARAQLLLAHVDPLLRMLAELLCLRGWGGDGPSAFPQRVSDGGSDDAGEKASEVNALGDSSLLAHAEQSGATRGIAYAALVKPFLTAVRLVVSLISSLVAPAQDRQSTSITNPRSVHKRLHSSVSASTSHSDCVPSSNPLTRLRTSLQGGVRRYVCDTHHTFQSFSVTSVHLQQGDALPKSQAPFPATDTTAKEEATSPHAFKAVATCRRAVGVYWLHGRCPPPTSASSPPATVVILLLCPSLLQGDGLYPYVVSRISHLCQLLTLAGAWQAAHHENTNGEEQEPSNASTSPGLVQWYAAVPVVEIAAATNASIDGRTGDAVSRPPLKLKDLQLVVDRLRKLQEPQQQQQQQPQMQSKPASQQKAPPPQRVFIVAVGWSEAASPLLELAMTQRQQQPPSGEKWTSHHSSARHARQDVASTARLDGLVCLSHTLSSAFQLLPQQREDALWWGQRQAFPSVATSAVSSLSPSFSLRGKHRVSESSSASAAPSGAAGSHHGYEDVFVSPRRAVVAHGVFAAPHIPRVLSHLTTGPARLLLLLTRLQLIADNLIEQRHSPDRSAAAATSSLSTASTPRSFYFALQRFREARELANALQRGVDVPTLLWSQHLQQQQQQQLQSRRLPRGRSGNVFMSALPANASRAADDMESAGSQHASSPSPLSFGSASQQQQQQQVMGVASPTSAAGAYTPSPLTEGTTMATAQPFTQHGLRGIPTSTHAEARRANARMAATSDSIDGIYDTLASPQPPPTQSSSSDASAGRRNSRGFSGHLPSHPFAHQQQQQQQQTSTTAALFHSPYVHATQDPSLYLASLPHLETLTDWEELVRSDAMAEAQEQQRRDTANATAANLPNPPSVDSPMALRAAARVSATTRDDANSSTSSSRYVGPPREPTAKDAVAGSSKMTTTTTTATTATMPLPHRPSSHVSSPLLPLPASFSQSLRSIHNHMSTEDVIASCTLQCLTPTTTRHSSRYPDTLRGSSLVQTPVTGNEHVTRTLARQASSDVYTRSGAAAVGHPPSSSLLGRPNNGDAASSLAVPGGASFMRQSSGDGFYSAAAVPSSALTDLADVSFSSPYSLARGQSSTAPSFQSAAGAPGLEGEEGEQERQGTAAAGGLRNTKGESTTCWMVDSAHQQQPQRVEDDAHNAGSDGGGQEEEEMGHSKASPNDHAIVELLPPADPTNAPLAAAGGVVSARTGKTPQAPSPPQAPAPPPAGSSLPHDLYAASFSSAALADNVNVSGPASPSPPPQSQPPIPYPPPPPPRTRALNSQAAALVELRVRSAQHAALIQRIRIPTLLLHARDDPVAPPSTVPFSLLQANPWIATVLTRRGSHATYMEGASDVWRRPYLVVEEVPVRRRGRARLRGAEAAAALSAGVVDYASCGGGGGEVATPYDGNDWTGESVSSSSTSTSGEDSPSSSTSANDNRESGTAVSEDSNADFRFNSSAENEDQVTHTVPHSVPLSSPQDNVEGLHRTDKTRWRVRVEGTTWVERLLFEYVEQVILAPAVATAPA